MVIFFRFGVPVVWIPDIPPSESGIGIVPVGVPRFEPKPPGLKHTKSTVGCAYLVNGCPNPSKRQVGSFPLNR